MKRHLTIGYGAVCYVVFLASFLYSVGFVGDLVVPRTVDHGIEASLVEALIVDALLLAVFAVQHSVMARPAFKRWWTGVVPTVIERSTYVLFSSLALILLFWQWRSMPMIIWDVPWTAGRMLLWVLFAAGWMIVLLSTFMISHFDLFGLRQVYLAWRGKPYSELPFRTSMFYRVVRHPIMLGFIVAFWAIPTMTAGHLLFAVATTGYILVAIQLEEHDLGTALGTRYQDYRSQVPMLVPGLHPSGHHSTPSTTPRPA